MSKRKILLINPKFQLSFMAHMAVMALFVVGVIFFANQLFFNEFHQQGRALGLPPEHVFYQFLNEQQRTMNWIFGLTAFGVTGVISVMGLYLSHRVAGPMYRLLRHFEASSDGEKAAQVKFRERDYFQEVAEACNRMQERQRGSSSPKKSDQKAA